MISIVMATYNGANYIKDQLNSIVPYMGPMDELIISDDGSTDETRNIINNYIKSDTRIKMIEGPQKGVVKNFENALFEAQGEIIMFSDQDDVWLPEKLPTIRELFEAHPEINLIYHDLYICSNEQLVNGEVGTTNYNTRKWHHGILPNILFNAYYGCCMAMRKDFIKPILPFSENTIAYDQLIGLMAERTKSSMFLVKPLIKRRVHGNNMTHKLSFFDKLRFRHTVWKSYRETVNRMN